MLERQDHDDNIRCLRLSHSLYQLLFGTNASRYRMSDFGWGWPMPVYDDIHLASRLLTKVLLTAAIIP